MFCILVVLCPSSLLFLKVKPYEPIHYLSHCRLEWLLHKLLNPISEECLGCFYVGGMVENYKLISFS